MKADVRNRTHKLWSRDYSAQICAEPVLVPRPSATEEDDGEWRESTVTILAFRRAVVSDPNHEGRRQALRADAQRGGHVGAGALRGGTSTASRLLRSVLLVAQSH